MRKRTRRKHWGLTDPIKLAMEGAAITPERILDELRLVELSAIQSFATGTATVDDWKALADMANVAQTLAEMGVGPEVRAPAQQVESVLGESHQRYQATGRMGTTGPGLQAMRELFAFHDAQRTSIARSAYHRAVQRTSDRIRSAHPDLKVCIA